MRFATVVVCATGLSLASAWASAQPAYRLKDLTPWTDCNNTSPCAEAWAINASGQVTGTTNTATQGWPAFRGDKTSSLMLDSLDGGSYSLGWDINASGRVTGFSYVNLYDFHAVVWDGTTIRDLGTLGGVEASGTAINDAGHVAGFSAITADRNSRHAFYWNGTTMRDLGTLGGDHSDATDLNAAGQVVGGADVDEWTRHAFRWEGGTMQDLGTLADPQYYGSYAVAINDSGQVAGESMTLPDADVHAFFWDGVMHDLGTLGGRESRAVALNDNGEVAGNSSFTTGAYLSRPGRAFFWDGATMRDLGTLGGATSEANDMNSSGYIVGVSSTASVAQLASPFLWDGATMRDLNTLVDPGDPLKPYVKLYQAWRINDRGDVATEGVDSRRPGNVHVFLMSRVSSTVVLEGFGRPVDPVPTLNQIVSGRVVPLRFRVTTSQGTPVIDVTGVDFTVRKARCGSLGSTDSDPVERYARQRRGLQNLGRGNYQYNWKTGADAKGCRVVSLGLPSEYNSAPAAVSAYFQFSN